MLLGGPTALHLERDLYRKASEKNPLPFVLERVSRAALAKDTAAEMPAAIPGELTETVNALVALATQDAGVELHRVGAIYTFLKWIFLPSEKARQWVDLAPELPLPANPHVTDADLQPTLDVQAFEARPEEWPATVDNFFLETPHTCAKVVAAIEKIASQGEGLSQTEDSHFLTFLALVKAFDEGEFTALPIAKSPTLGEGNGPEEGAEISHPYTREWGAVFSLQYSLLILTIDHALRTPRTTDASASLRASLVDLALRSMRRTLLSVSAVCVSLPMGDDPSVLAGPPYDLHAEILQVSDESDRPKRHLELLDRLESHYAAIEHAAEFGSRPTDANTLANVRSVDKRRRTLFSPLNQPL